MKDRIHFARFGMQCLLLLFLIIPFSYNHGAIYTVINTADAGPGSLRQAILDANANVSNDPDTIAFNIPGNGPHTIIPTSSLPNISDPIFIDGLSQPGAFCGSWPPKLLVEIDGMNLIDSGLSLTSGSNGSTLQGLVVNNFGNVGIAIISSNDNSIYCNFIGTDPTGTQAKGNDSGIALEGACSNIKIGGLEPGQRNLISGNNNGIVPTGDTTNFSSNVEVINNFMGTDVNGTSAVPNNEPLEPDEFATNWRILQNLISGNRREALEIDEDASFIYVYGNYIGTDVTGTQAIPNSTLGGDEAIVIDERANNIFIGGSKPGQGNIIAGNARNGFEIDEGVNKIFIQGNKIGVDINNDPLPNQGSHGLVISGSAFNVKVGGTAPNEGNIIAYHGQNGIFLANENGPAIPFNIEISGNSIFNNGALGIDLSPIIIDTDQDPGDGLSPNDGMDTDLGPNDLQNFPIITNVTREGGFKISGTLNSTPNTNGFRIEFFSNTTCNGDQSGNAQDINYGEGEFFLGSTLVNTDANGEASFEVILPIQEGTFLTATATDPNGQTSEFSQCFETAPLALPALTFGAKMALGLLVLSFSLFLSGKRFYTLF